ncbi:MAG: alpha/beta hydrolase [Lachnospiraceae bacterium]
MENTADKNGMLLGEEDYIEKMTYMVKPLLENNREEGYFPGFKGIMLHYEYYKNRNERAAIVVSHGFCEFAKKFEEVAYYFLQAGYSVYIPEHRGHGYSQRQVSDKGKVSVRSYEEYVRDLHAFITEVVLAERPDRTLVLYGHSMGGTIAALYLERYPKIFSRAVLSSPMMEIDLGRWPAPVVWVLMLLKKLLRSEEDYAPGNTAFTGIPDFEGSSCLSRARYEDIFRKRIQDDNYQTNGAACAWIWASLLAVRRAVKKARFVKTPVLLFIAQEDRLVKQKGQRTFAKKSPCTELAVIAGAKHEIYNAGEKERKEYYRQLFAFLERK